MLAPALRAGYHPRWRNLLSPPFVPTRLLYNSPASLHALSPPPAPLQGRHPQLWARPAPPSSLPDPLCSALAPPLACITATDRGPAHNHNACTQAACSTLLSRWGSHRDFHNLSFASMTPAETGQSPAASVPEIATGQRIQTASRPEVHTSQVYVRAEASHAIDAGFDALRLLPA